MRLVSWFGGVWFLHEEGCNVVFLLKLGRAKQTCMHMPLHTHTH